MARGGARGRRAAVAVLALFAATGAAANGPETSPRPVARPKVVPASPEIVSRAAAIPPAQTRSLVTRKDALCGVKGIEGVPIPPIKGTLRGCGLKGGVEVRAVHGVTLSRPAKIDCPTARALAAWVEQGVKPQIGSMGGGLAQVDVVAHYACRTRNNVAGAKVSEHGRGRAVDIAGFTLKDGRQVPVLTGWTNAATGPILKRIHQAACGPFDTVLGLRANRYHKDHFHMDTARYRSGPYCR